MQFLYGKKSSEKKIKGIFGWKRLGLMFNVLIGYCHLTLTDCKLLLSFKKVAIGKANSFFKSLRLKRDCSFGVLLRFSNALFATLMTTSLYSALGTLG